MMMGASFAQDWRLAFGALFAVACLAILFVAFPANNLLIAAGIVAVSAFVIVAGWYPELFLVGCAFMPQWKNAWPLDRFASVGDLTLVMLLGLLLGIAWRTLRHVGRIERDTLPELFRGQWLVICGYVLFAAAVLASYAYTTAPNYGGVKLLRFLLIGTLFLYSGMVLARDEESFRRIASLFVLAACVTACQMIFHLEHRAVGEETDITRIGAGWLLGMGILLLLGYPIVNNARRYLCCVVVALPLLSAGLIASASRGPMVSLAIALVLTMFWFAKKQFAAIRVWVAVLLVGSSVASFFYLRHMDPDKYNAKLSEMIELSSGHSASGSGAKRLDFYSRTLAAIPENLWLGRGIGSWSVFYYGRDMRDYPHNLLLETTFEEGVVGASLLLLFLALLAMAIRRMLIATDFQYGVLAGLLVYCFSVSMFSGDLDDNRLLWLWAGIILAVCRNAYLEAQRRKLLERFQRCSQLNIEIPVPATSTARSVFSHPQAIKG
jgi:O-antigen ligase